MGKGIAQYDYLCKSEVEVCSDKVSILVYPLILFIINSLFKKFQFGISLSGVIVPIILFIIFAVFNLDKIKLSRGHAIIVLFWIFSTFSTLKSNLTYPQRDILTFLVFCIFFIMSTGTNYNKSEIKIIIATYIIVCIICSINIIFNFMRDISYSWGRYSLYIGNFPRDPNYVSSFILASIGISCYKISVSKNINFFKRIIFMLIIITVILASLFTGSRTAFMFTVIIFTLSLIYYLFKTRLKIINFIIVFMLLMIIITLFRDIVPESIINRVTNFESYGENIRITLWKQGFELFKQFPILGGGLGSLSIYLSEFSKYNSHNVYLDILCGQGLIGIVLLLILFKEFTRVQKKDKFFMYIIIISFFAPLFSINGFNSTTFWTPIILCQIFSNYSRSNKGGITDMIQEL